MDWTLLETGNLGVQILALFVGGGGGGYLAATRAAVERQRVEFRMEIVRAETLEWDFHSTGREVPQRWLEAMKSTDLKVSFLSWTERRYWRQVTKVVPPPSDTEAFEEMLDRKAPPAGYHQCRRAFQHLIFKKLSPRFLDRLRVRLRVLQAIRLDPYEPWLLPDSIPGGAGSASVLVPQTNTEMLLQQILEQLKLNGRLGGD